MKPYILFLNLLMISLFNCFGQCSKDVNGKISDWVLVCGNPVPANTQFQVTAKGKVDFGCWLGRCKDGAEAGVTSGAFLRWVKDNKEDILELIKLGIQVASKADGSPPSWIGYINQIGSECNYDEGGAWIAITNNNQPPTIANTVCIPALYYWYAQLNDKSAYMDLDKNARWRS
jgi:hypothetical protein